jgi:hypothetical protein
MLDLARIDGSILILLIFQKEEVARTDAKVKMEDAIFSLQRLFKMKIQKFIRFSYLQFLES